MVEINGIEVKKIPMDCRVCTSCKGVYYYKYGGMTGTRMCKPCYMAKLEEIARKDINKVNHITGMSDEQLIELKESQGNKCAKCKIPFGPNVTYVLDHDHSCCPPGAKRCGLCHRGIVCNSCNLYLAGYDSYMEKRQEFDDYIKAYNRKRVALMLKNSSN